MAVETRRPTRREERRTQTVQEIKTLAMEQIRAGGPESVSLSGIVREMSMSPAAVYRYFASRDALLADLVVDAYDDFADLLESLAAGGSTAEETLRSVLDGVRAWAGQHPNAYRLIFQTSVGSGQDLAPERTVPAATRSMRVVLEALAEAQAGSVVRSGAPPAAPPSDQADPSPDGFDEVVRAWGARAGLPACPPLVLRLALATWTRLHGVISLELGGHLGATGIDPGVLYAAEVEAIVRAVTGFVDGGLG